MVSRWRVFGLADWIEKVANVIDGEFNHVFPQYSSPIKMVGHPDGEKWSSGERSNRISLRRRNVTAYDRVNSYNDGSSLNDFFVYSVRNGQCICHVA